MEKNIALVFMVAGMSSRFGGKIKGLIEIGPNTEKLIEVSLNNALALGFSKIILIVSNNTYRYFKEFFGDSFKNVKIEYVFQEFDGLTRDKPWGTADALCCVKEVINEPFILCNGDDIYGKEDFKTLYDHLQNENDAATLGFDISENVPDEGGVTRGIFEDKDRYVSDIVETFDVKKTDIGTRLLKDSLVNGNIFALHPSIVDLVHDKLIEFKEKNKGNRNIEFLLPVEFSKLIKENKINMRLYKAVKPFIGITNPGDEEILRKILEKQS